jgi:hypothetical protein
MTTTQTDMHRLNPDVKEEWLKALRSGEYQQCQSQLRKVDGEGHESFCCLGVLTELHRKKFGGEWVDHIRDRGSEYLYVDERGGLPSVVQGWAGLHPLFEPAVPYEPRGGQVALAFLNDVEDFTFSKIADLIEEHL